MHCKTYDVVAPCLTSIELTGKIRRSRSRPAEQAHTQCGMGSTSPPTARVWVNASWSPDAPAKKRTISLSAAERGVLNDVAYSTDVPKITASDKPASVRSDLPCLLPADSRDMHDANFICARCPGNAPVSDYPAGDQYRDEQREAQLCDSGLPDTEVCDVLHIPPRESEVVSEAWSRGYGVTKCLYAGASAVRRFGIICNPVQSTAC